MTGPLGAGPGPARARFGFLWGALLLLAVTSAYLPALRHGGFVWDDDFYVSENPLLRSPEGLARIWAEPGASPQYYPAAFTTFWVEWRLWGENPLGYRAVNLLLHGGNAILLAVALGRLGVPGAKLSAWVFALHPVHVESVAWVAERKNVLSGLFYLCALLAYLRSSGLTEGAVRAQEAPSRPAGRRGWYWASAALFALALLSKSVTASLPAVLLLILWWKRGRVSRSEALALVPFFFLGAVAGLHTAWLEKTHVGAYGPEWEHSWLERALIAGRVLWFYLGKLLWPSGLAAVYPRWEIDPGAAWQYAYPLAALAVLFLLWKLSPRIGRGPAAAALFFAVTLFPVMGFLDVYPMLYSFVADHYQYLASIGPIAAVSSLAAGACARLGLRGGRALAIAAFLLPVLAVLTWQRAHAFRDMESLWRDTLSKNPAAWVGHYNLGVVLAGRGERAEAEDHFREALRLRPQYLEARHNLAAVLAEQGRWDEAAATFAALAEENPGDPMPRYNLGRLAAAAGRAGEAEDHFRAALRLDPGYADARYALAQLAADRGSTQEAIEHLEQVLEAQPDHVGALNDLASHAGAAGNLEEAQGLFARAVALRPDDVLLRVNRARALAALGRRDEAAAELRAALRLAPGDGAIREELRALAAPDR